MLLITHIRFDGRARFYENITHVCCTSREAHGDQVPGARVVLSVAQIIAAIRSGRTVLSAGAPQVAVETYTTYGKDFIRSGRAATSSNDLLSLPEF